MSWLLRRFFLYQSHGAIFGGGGVSTAGEAIGLLLTLTKAS